MNNAEMNVVRFDANDVIATSGVYLSNVWDNDVADTKISFGGKDYTTATDFVSAYNSTYGVIIADSTLFKYGEADTEGKAISTLYKNHVVNETKAGYYNNASYSYVNGCFIKQ